MLYYVYTFLEIVENRQKKCLVMLSVQDILRRLNLLSELHSIILTKDQVHQVEKVLDCNPARYEVIKKVMSKLFHLRGGGE